MTVTTVGAPARGATDQQAQAGGTLKFNVSGTDVDFSDPTLAYTSLSWQIEYATALKLYNYPDEPAPAGSVLTPEAATGLPVISADGKTYTITVKSGFRFSDGTPVTADNFAFAINRALNPTMSSPATFFIKNIAGVQVAGSNLIITLTQPDPSLTAKLAMPFFQALPLNLPTDPQGVLVYPSAGPYYWASRDVGHAITIKKNSFYTGTRPANADEFDITVNTNADQSLLQVKSNEVDYDLGALPPSAHAGLGATYGVNIPSGQYHVNPLVETDYAALNTSRAPFSNVNLRKAANFAIDRAAMNSARGAYAGTATDQILPPGMPGFRDVQVYLLDGPRYDVAKSLAGGSCGTVKLWGVDNAIGQAQAQVFKANLEQIGCTVQVTLFQPLQLYAAAGHKGADFDAVLAGWNQDYPDPYDFLDVLLNGNNIKDDGNNNLAYFNDPAINTKLAQANGLVGDARYQAYGDLDAEITRDYAPWVAYDNRNAREFVAPRIGGFVFQPISASADLNTFFIRTNPQSITFAALGNKTYGDPDFAVDASATSSLPVSFIGSGDCTVSGATVHLMRAGSCTVTALQTGDASYVAAAPVSQTVAIAKAAQTIAFGSLTDKTVGDPDFTVSASASSGLAVSLTATGNCASTGSTVHITGGGSCTVIATQPGDGNYNAAAPVSQTFAIAKAAQTITFGSLADKTVGDPDFPLSASASSGLAVSFAASGSCTVAAATVHLTGAGSCTVTASQPGNATYAAASDVSQSFAVLPLRRAIRCVVPKVIGKQLVSAKRSLATKHCRTGKVSYAYSSKGKKGAVVSQSRRPGQVLPEKTKVNLVVSRGRRP